MAKRVLTSYGRIIQKRLIDKEMTQVELAEHLGCNPGYLCQILYGERAGTKYREKISELLDIETVA